MPHHRRMNKKILYDGRFVFEAREKNDIVVNLFIRSSIKFYNSFLGCLFFPSSPSSSGCFVCPLSLSVLGIEVWGFWMQVHLESGIYKKKPTSRASASQGRQIKPNECCDSAQTRFSLLCSCWTAFAAHITARTWRRSRFEFRINYKFIIYNNKSGMRSPLNLSANGRCIRTWRPSPWMRPRQERVPKRTSKFSLFINSIREHLRCLYSYFMNKIIVALISTSKLDTATQRHTNRSFIRFFGGGKKQKITSDRQYHNENIIRNVCARSRDTDAGANTVECKRKCYLSTRCCAGTRCVFRFIRILWWWLMNDKYEYEWI